MSETQPWKFSTKYMTPEARALIKSLEGTRSFKFIYDLMVERGMPVPASSAKLRDRWLKVDSREKPVGDGKVRRCLSCRQNFPREFKWNFVCSPCKNSVMWD